jgi:CheY-like chemotaxis protein/anti-sigma regulatory factor (Ser/Thr protein kinase)
MTSILVVDDCSVDRRLVRGLLCCVADWEIRFAEDGSQALESISACRPDLVITDLQMPKVDGLQLVRALKRMRPQIPVVLMTAKGSEEIAVEALRAGAAYYTPKSALGRDLVPAVRQVLGISDHVNAAQFRGANDLAFHVQFAVENDDVLIGGLIEHLQVNLPPWANPDRMQIAMALHEAITNAMHHGNLEVGSELRDRCESAYVTAIQTRRGEAPFCDRRVRIDAYYRKDDVTFCVSDEGPGFNPAEVADPREAQYLERLSGRGLLLIRSFMDEVRHNPTGNQITMTKRNRAAVLQTE